MYIHIYIYRDRRGAFGACGMFWGITKIVMEQANMDRAGPRICDQRAAQLNVNFKTPGYIKINQQLLHIYVRVWGGWGVGRGLVPGTGVVVFRRNI